MSKRCKKAALAAFKLDLNAANRTKSTVVATEVLNETEATKEVHETMKESHKLEPSTRPRGRTKSSMTEAT